MAEFITPVFLQNNSTDEVHRKMLALLPSDIDASEGGHVWNLTRPTALIIAEMCEFILPELIKIIFPESSYGEYLDGHAKLRHLERHKATEATGAITITGEAGTVIPSGSLFSTASINSEPSVAFATTSKVTIPQAGSITAPIKCTEPGVIGNTPANTIIFNTSAIPWISAVTNENPTGGGADQESDESLIDRILEYDQNQGANFVGNASDYKRWATSVDGVGDAKTVPPEDDSGLVTIILTDASGQPASEQLCEAVYNYIMAPNNPDMRLAPVNASLSVVPPQTLSIAVKATVELGENYTIESARAAFFDTLSAYLSSATESSEIKYTKVWEALSSSGGVSDFTNLQIGIKGESFGTVNIAVPSMSVAVVSLDDIDLTEGTV